MLLDATTGDGNGQKVSRKLLYIQCVMRRTAVRCDGESADALSAIYPALVML